ncbi:hypothetical protein EMCRGX_G030400 [Ephydatia muelleri]
MREWMEVLRRPVELRRADDQEARTSASRTSHEVMDVPFERIAMDVVGPLPKTSSGNRYVLVICNYATRYPEAVPIKSVDVEKVAMELVKVFAGVGILGEILTDQGSNFTSQLLAEFYRMLHIQPIRTSPYHPQKDCLVEHFNQTLKAMLRKVHIQEGQDWDQLLPYVLFAYREIPQSTTGFSPFELLYWVANDKASESVVSHILSIREKMEVMMEAARENMGKVQQEQKTCYDQNVRTRNLNEGRMVLVLLSTSSNNLEAQWLSPYKVLKCIGKVNYLINMEDHQKRRRVLHINMLREFLPTDISVVCCCWAEGKTDADVDVEEEIPVWKPVSSNCNWISVQFGVQLTEKQKKKLIALSEVFSVVLSDTPGRTALVKHHIENGTARLITSLPNSTCLQGTGAPCSYVSMTNGQGDAWSKRVLFVIFSVSREKHLAGIRKVFARLQQAGLTAKPSKCVFGANKCKYLGHKVGNGVVEPDPSKVLAVLDFTVPTTKTQVRAFLGLTGYYRRFVPNYASLSVVLRDLTKKAAPSSVQWTEACNKALKDLNSILCSAPVLQSPDVDKEFVLQTDASSGRGVGAILSQRDENGDDHPVAYYSKKLLHREERYSTIEKECLAIKLGMFAFRTYLLGRNLLSKQIIGP